MAASAEIGIRAMRSVFQALFDHAEAHGGSHDDFMAGVVCQLEFAILQLRGEFGIEDSPQGSKVPEWLLDDTDRQFLQPNVQ